MSAHVVDAASPPRSCSPASPVGPVKPAGPALLRHPGTPISPPSMSQAHRDASSPATVPSSTASTSQMTATASPYSSPATSTAYSSQHPTMATSGPTNAMPTPASSVTGTIGPSSHPIGLGVGVGLGADEDTVMTNAGDDVVEVLAGPTTTTTAPSDAVVAMDTDDHRRSDHDRHGTMDIKEEPGATADPTNAGPSSVEQSGRRTGSLYLLCRTAHAPSQPHSIQNLMKLYHLQGLANSVARNDPITGEKRAIRKTYKGKIKQFGLSGRDKEVKHPEGEPGGLVEMSAWPEEEWFSQKVAGKGLEKGLRPDTWDRLEAAMTMEAGPIPGFDASILGLEAATAATPSAVDNKKAAAQAAGTTRALHQSNGASSRPVPVRSPAAATTNDAAQAEAARPRRTTKKRRYDDHSFEGYGEGFLDDEADMGAGYSDNDDRRSSGSGKKKRKKNADPYAPSPGLVDRGGSYGVGMVGIGTGVGAYGAR